MVAMPGVGQRGVRVEGGEERTDEEHGQFEDHDHEVL